LSWKDGSLLILGVQRGRLHPDTGQRGMLLDIRVGEQG
jgi:hypothetical protein